MKTRAWYGLAADERWRIMTEHIELGREYPNIDINTWYSFGFDDQEFVVAFETTTRRLPRPRAALAQTSPSLYTLQDTPAFSCICAPIVRALEASTANRSSPSDLADAVDPPGEIRDITMIGAGPVGLSTAFWAGIREARSRIIDSLPQLGGQLTTLYPEKWIFDVPGHPRILARDLVE